MMRKLLMWILLLLIPLLGSSQITTDSINVFVNTKGDTLVVMSPNYVKMWHKTILQLEQCQEINVLLDKEVVTYEEFIKRQEAIIDTLKQETIYLRNALVQCDSIKAISDRMIDLYKEEVQEQKKKKHLWQGGTGLAVLILIISLL